MHVIFFYTKPNHALMRQACSFAVSQKYIPMQLYHLSKHRTESTPPLNMSRQDPS